MPIQIGAKGANLFGQAYPPYAYIDWFTPDQEGVATAGGDAVIVPPRLLTAAEIAAFRASMANVPIFVGRAAALLAGYPVAAYAGKSAWVTDMPGSSLLPMYDNGRYWVPQRGSALILHSCAPMFVAPSCSSINPDGTGMILSGPLPLTGLADCWLYVPANAPGNAQAEGWRYAVMTDATHGRLYLNRYDPTASTDNSFPSVLQPCVNASTWTGISGANPGGTTAGEVLALRMIIPGGLMGSSGELLWDTRSEWTSGAETKVVKVKVGGVAITSPSQTTNLSYRATHRLWCCGLPTKQLSSSSVADGASASHDMTVQTINFNGDVAVDVTLAIGSNTNNCSLGLLLFDLMIRNI